jgi:hypothetical protein
MSERMIGGLIGVALGLGLIGLLTPLGLFRWWGRRRHIVQLLLLLLIPVLLVTLIVLVSSSFALGLGIELVGGLLMGAVWAVVLPLVATSHLIRRVRGLEDGDDADSSASG